MLVAEVLDLVFKFGGLFQIKVTENPCYGFQQVGFPNSIPAHDNLPRACFIEVNLKGT